MNPFLIKEPTCISFSGGRTSAYMLYRVLQAHDMSLPDEAMVLFCNTGKEAEPTLKFVHDCETNWGVKIHWLEYTAQEPKVRVVDYHTASRDGQPFEEVIRLRKMLPNVRARFCTVELKIRTMSRFTKQMGWDSYVNFIGIRADDPRRVAKMRPDSKREDTVMPLAMAGISKTDVLEFWKKQPFDLELEIINGETIEGNCDLCFLKATPKIMSLIKKEPERAIWWAKQEEYAQTVTNGDGNRFRIDRPRYAEISNFIDKQSDMFDESIECFCGD